ATAFEDQVVIAHAGDSRAYLIRDGIAQRLTDDHSWVAEQQRRGIISAEEAVDHPLRHTITRALGGNPELIPDVTRIRVAPGDRVILCTDGLTNEVAESDLDAILSRAADPQAAADSLVAAANEAGGRDNISVVVVEVSGEAREDE